MAPPLRNLALFTVLSAMLPTMSAGAGPHEPPREQPEIFGSLPGLPKWDARILEKFDKRKASLDASYRPRTDHLRKDGWAKFTNRLFLETSPYLLQHAHNPVNWYPWGDEAFEEAKRRGVPVFLSVGYSTCYWCHVMEKESFEDEEIAEFINRNYVAIKVDREERPDVDGIYMAAVEALTGSGGWPMSVWLTPGRRPFYGGTYLPARDGDRGNGVGFLTLMKRLSEAYREQSQTIADQADELTESIAQHLKPEGGEKLPGEEVLHETFEWVQQRFDPKNGGLQSRDKFPTTLPVSFLLRYHLRSGNDNALEMAEYTLERMMLGGIRDHVGGGFHRYSVDPEWKVPHFEKMLYDNALIASDYLELYLATSNQDYEAVVTDTLDYVLRELTSPEGAFYSSTDAVSPGPDGKESEGYYYTWTPAEVQAVLGSDASRFNRVFNVTAAGNHEGRNVLHMDQVAAKTAEKVGMTTADFKFWLKQSLERLREARSKREAPFRDDKILASWNGLMISALARAGLYLSNKRYTGAATKAADDLIRRLGDGSRISHSFKDGRKGPAGFLEDYAFLIAGLLDLYEATHQVKWFEKAMELDRTLKEAFEDSDGGYRMTSDDHDGLLIAEKPVHDGATPSGNSVQLENLLRLAEFTAEEDYRERAAKQMKFLDPTLEREPLSATRAVLALDFYLDHTKEVVIVTPDGKKSEADVLMSEFRRSYVPNRVLSVVQKGDEQEETGKFIPMVSRKYPRKGKATAYVCERGACQLPTSDPQRFSEQIRRVKEL